MFKCALALSLVFIASFGAIMYLDGDTPLWVFILGLSSLVLSAVFLLVDKAFSDIKYLKRFWKLGQQYKRERKAEREQIVSSGEARKRYRRALRRHMFFARPDDETLDGYIKVDDEPPKR